jgi:hypothetical protein
MNPQGPQQTQQPQQPPAQQAPSQPQPMNNGQFEKKRRNAAVSSIGLGTLCLIIGLIALLGLSSVDEDIRAATTGYFALAIIISILWIVFGVMIKKAQDAKRVAATLNLVAIAGALLFLVTVVLSIALQSNGGGLFGIIALVMAIYAFVAGRGIKKLG